MENVNVHIRREVQTGAVQIIDGVIYRMHLPEDRKTAGAILMHCRRRKYMDMLNMNSPQAFKIMVNAEFEEWKKDTWNDAEYEGGIDTKQYKRFYWQHQWILKNQLERMNELAPYGTGVIKDTMYDEDLKREYVDFAATALEHAHKMRYEKAKAMVEYHNRVKLTGIHYRETARSYEEEEQGIVEIQNKKAKPEASGSND